jgi:hypothetical protein
VSSLALSSALVGSLTLLETATVALRTPAGVLAPTV